MTAAADTLFVDPVGGVAGDMFLAACLDLGVKEEALVAELGKLGLGGWRLEVKRDHEASIAGLHVDVVVEGEQPHERGYLEVVRIVEESGLSPRAKAAALAVFRVIGEAEAHVHDKPLETIHFHEVGAVDSLVDVCGAAVCLELLGWPRVLHAPAPAGGGTARTVHGIIPLPAPATLQIMKGRTLRASGPGERTTPTGAGILKALGAEVASMPDLAIDRVGYGVGTKRWEDAPNALRVVLGRSATAHDGETMLVLEANLDDATGQVLARAVEAALEAGAADAWVVPATGKKGRPAHVLAAICGEAAAASVRESMVAESTTLGVRTTRCERQVLDRRWREVATPWGAVRVKEGLWKGRVVNVAPEHDDCLALAREHGVPLKVVLQVALAAAVSA